MSLKSQLESLLFISSKPLSVKELANASKAKNKDIEEALKELKNEYKENDRGITLVENNSKYQLSTSSENADLIKEFIKDESSGELSQASLEALTIIAYRGPIAKMELERIRGINCSMIIRNLLMRGLIEEKAAKNKEDNYYIVTHDFIRFLGIDSIKDLPDYEKLSAMETIDRMLESSEELNS